jgi:hypothetical protein
LATVIGRCYVKETIAALYNQCQMAQHYPLERQHASLLINSFRQFEQKTQLFRPETHYFPILKLPHLSAIFITNMKDFDLQA